MNARRNRREWLLEKFIGKAKRKEKKSNDFSSSSAICVAIMKTKI
jgi:hypothetical protein